jgi:hypothetical protein
MSGWTILLIVVLVIVVLALIVVALQLPDIRRYRRMRSM